MNKRLNKIVKQEVAKLTGKKVESRERAALRRMRQIIADALETAGSASDERTHFTRTWKSMLHEYSTVGISMKEKTVLSDRLKDYRNAHNLTQDELAAKIGVGRRQLIRWEQAETTPHNVFIKKMEELGIKVSRAG